MTQLSQMIVRISGSEITIDAEALAPKLGLSIEALKDNMAKGLVMSVVETGVDEDAGRSRLTFFYRARTWRVVLEADGTLIDDTASAGKQMPSQKDRASLLDMVRDAS